MQIFYIAGMNAVPEMILAEFVHDSKRQVFADDQKKCHDDVMKPLQCHHTHSAHTGFMAILPGKPETCLTLLFLRAAAYERLAAAGVEISSRSEQKIYGCDLLALPTYCSRLSRKQRLWQKDGGN